VIPAGVIHDVQHNRDLQVSIDYPTHGGPYPVVIFSHEYGAPDNAYVGLSSFWASHGYVVIRPRHADFGAMRDAQLQPFPVEPVERDRRGGRRGNQPSPQQQQARPFRPDPAEEWPSAQKPSDWANRVNDIKLVVDSIPQLLQSYPEIKERVDTTKIGVGGHSYGGFAAMLIGGAQTFAGTTATSYADPRVKAIEAMSPPGPAAERGLTAQSFSTIRIPALFLTGSMDYGALQSEDPNWRRQAFELSPAGDKWFVNVMGVGPSAFTGRFGTPEYIPQQQTPAYYPNPGPGGSPAPQPVPQNQPRNAPGNFRALGQATTVRTVSLAFWDAYLKGDNTGRTYLNGLLTRSDMQAATK
ncbi:MAG TPA: hypothetical protein VLU46_10590, partial [Thermoanaerobaculia bacterium]|nr:hypothetical protein [Thermoanaerobaculia bacterium]